MANYELNTQQNHPACGIQDTGLNLQQLIDKGVVAIAGVANGIWYRYEFSQN